MKISGPVDWATASDSYMTPTGCGVDLYCTAASMHGRQQCPPNQDCNSTEQLVQLGKTVVMDHTITDEKDNPVWQLHQLLEAFKFNSDMLQEKDHTFHNSLSKLKRALVAVQTWFDDIGKKFAATNEKVKSRDRLINMARDQFEEALELEEGSYAASQDVASFVRETCDAMEKHFCDYYVLELDGQNMIALWMLISMIIVFTAAVQVLDYLDTQLATEPELPLEAPPAYQPDMEDMDVPNVPDYGDEAPPEYPPEDN
jgi:hypothetical protein